MIVIIIEKHSCKLEIVTNYSKKINGYIRLSNLLSLRMVIYSKIFFLLKAVLDWINHISVSNIHVNI